MSDKKSETLKNQEIPHLTFQSGIGTKHLMKLQPQTSPTLS